MHEKERKKIVKRQFYMTYLSQTSDDKYIGNIQFSNKGKLRKKKINEVIENHIIKQLAGQHVKNQVTLF